MTDTKMPTDPEVVTVMDVIDTLEELVGSGRRLPFTPSVVVNEEDILELVDRIRVALPDDLLAARHTVEERSELLERAARDAEELLARAREQADRLLRDAQERADRVLGDAQTQAATLVEASAISRSATEQARALVTEAEARAASQRRDADEYARDVMQRLEEQLERTMATVRAGLGALPEAPSPKRRRAR